MAEPTRSADPAEFEMTSGNGCAIEPAMITVAASNYWYFSFDSSLAVGGSRSI
jgi:hypothetical protein